MTKEQEEMLNDTINHFNSSNRSKVEGKTGCTYLPAHSNSQGCAIGRLIEDKALCKEFDSFGVSGVGNEKVFEKLPLELKYLGQNFLNRVQQLHDWGHFWSEGGLNDRGLREVENIKNNFK